MPARKTTKRGRAGVNEKLVAVEKRVEKAAKKAVRTARASLDEARANRKLVAIEKKVGRAARKAGHTIMHSTLSDAVAAVRRTAKSVARRLSAGGPAAKRSGGRATTRRVAGRA